MIAIDFSEKPSRRRGNDPVAEKDRDNSRQRKIVANASDKAARRNAPLIKARANRKARLKGKITLTDTANHDDSAQSITSALRQRRRNWGSVNAAEHRAERLTDNRLLNATAGCADLPKGRSRLIHLDDATKAQLATGIE